MLVTENIRLVSAKTMGNKDSPMGAALSVSNGVFGDVMFGGVTCGVNRGAGAISSDCVYLGNVKAYLKNNTNNLYSAVNIGEIVADGGNGIKIRYNISTNYDGITFTDTKGSIIAKRTGISVNGVVDVN